MGVFTPDQLFADRKLLEDNKIELPSVTSLAKKLSEKGFCVDENTRSEAELIASLIEDLRGRGLCEK